MEGGYQILNLSRWNLTSTSTKIKGAYGFIDNNTEHKTVLLEGLMLEGKRYDAIFTTFAKAADNYVGNFVLNDMIYTIIVLPNDNINIRKLEPVSDTDLNNIVSDEWNASTEYSAGAYVLRSNKLYVALLPSTGKDPLTEPDYWEQKKLTDATAAPWSYVGTTVGSGSISLPTGCTEIYVEVFIKDNQSIILNTSIIKSSLLSSEKRYRLGSITEATSFVGAIVGVTSSVAYLFLAVDKYGDCTTTSRITVYAR